MSESVVSDIAYINPPLPRKVGDREPVTFIRMNDVSEAGGIHSSEAVPFGTVKNGFTQFAEGDVLFTKITPCMENGKGAYALGLSNGIGCGSTEFHVLRAKPGHSAAFLYQICQSVPFRKKAECFMTGSAGQQRVQTALFSEYRLTIPPEKVQRRIAEILSTVDEAIAQTEALIAKTQQIKAGLMHDLFTRGVTADGQLRPPREEAPQLYKQSPLGWIPKEWEVAAISDCGSVKLGRQRNPSQHSGKWSMPYLRVANVYEGFIDENDVLEMDFTPEERSLYSVAPGDILLNEGQSLELVGRSAMFRGGEGRYCFQNTLVRFRAIPSHSPGFFQWLFVRNLHRGVFHAIAKQTTSVAHLGADRFAKMKCPIVPFAEQKQIEMQINSLQEQIQENIGLMHKLRSLKSALMSDLLTGRVRVPVKES
jgi:type I restriction enzyme, S subunit